MSRDIRGLSEGYQQGYANYPNFDYNQIGETNYSNAEQMDNRPMVLADGTPLYSFGGYYFTDEAEKDRFVSSWQSNGFVTAMNNSAGKSIYGAALDNFIATSEAAAEDAALAINILDNTQTIIDEAVDEATLSPAETSEIFTDLGDEVTGGNFYGDTVTADEQSDALDAANAAALADPDYDISQGATPYTLADATVGGQVQIRNDITGAVDSLNAQSIATAISLLSGLGISTSDMIGPIVNADGTVSYQTKTGKDITSLVSSLADSIENKIAGVAGETVGNLGYGGVDQQTLAQDIAAISSGVSNIPLTDLTGLEGQITDIPSALSDQFGSLTTEIQTVGGKVDTVDEVVDRIETGVGTITDNQIDMIEDLSDLGLDADEIIATLGRVEGGVEQSIENQAGYAQRQAQGLARLGVDTAIAAENQEQLGSTLGQTVRQALTDEFDSSFSAAYSDNFSDIAESLEGIDTGTANLTKKQQEWINKLSNTKDAVSELDKAITGRLSTEYGNLLDVFDENGTLMESITTEMGKELTTALNDDGNLIISSLETIGESIGDIDLSEGNLSTSIDNALTAIGEYSSYEAQSAQDRNAVIKALNNNKSQLDTFLTSELPTVIDTEFGQYELKIDANNNVLAAKIATDTATAVDFNQADLVSALSAADAYDEAALVSAIGFNPADAATTKTAAQQAASRASSVSKKIDTQTGMLKTDRTTTANFVATIDKIKAGDIATLGQLDASAVTAIEQAVGYNEGDLTSAIRTGVTTDIDLSALNDLSTQEISQAIEGSTIRRDLTTVAADADMARQKSIHADNKAARIETIANALKGDEAAITALINNKTANIEGETLKLNKQNQLIIEDTEGIEGLPGTIETNLGVRFDSVDSAVNGLENLDSSAITAAVEASTITSTLSGVAADAATAATEATSAADLAGWARGRVKTVQEELIPEVTGIVEDIQTYGLRESNIAQLQTLDADTIRALANEVDYDAETLVNNIQAGALSVDDLNALSTLTPENVTAAIEASSTLVATKGVVDDIKAGDIATLGELDADTISALANAVDYDASALISSVNEGRLSPDDLTALSTLTSDDITNAVDLSGLSTLEASDVTGAVDASTIVSNINTVVGNIKSAALTDSDLDTLGELDASVISSLVDKVDEKVAGSIDREGLITRITQNALTTTDLDNLALLTPQDVTDAVDLSGLSTLTAGDVTAAVGYDSTALTNDFKSAVGDSEQALTELANGNVATITGEIGTYQAFVTGEGELLVSAFDNLTGEVQAVDSKVGNLDLTALDDIDSIKATVEALPAEALDISGLATATDVEGVGTAVETNLGPASLLRSNIEGLLSYTETDLENFNKQDAEIRKFQADAMKSLLGNPAKIKELVDNGVTQIQGSFNTYQLGFNNQTGEIVAKAFEQSEHDLSGQIDTQTNTLLGGVDSIDTLIDTNKTNLYKTLDDAFDENGKLIESAEDDLGNKITRVINDEGELVETVTGFTGELQDQVTTPLGDLLDDTGNLKSSVAEVSRDVQTRLDYKDLTDAFDKEGLLKRQEFDEFGNRISRQFDSNNDLLIEYFDSNDNFLRSNLIKLNELMERLFPSAPLAEPEELTEEDEEFLLGMQTDGIMSY